MSTPLPIKGKAAAQSASAGDVKPLLDVQRLAGKSPADVEKLLGKAAKVETITRIPLQMPGEFRDYRLAGLEVPVMVRFYRGEVASVMVIWNDANKMPASVMLARLGLQESSLRALAKTNVFARWEGSAGEKRLALHAVRSSRDADSWSQTNIDFGITPRPLGVTASGYAALTNGMSYGQVTAILGSEGNEISRNHVAGIETVMYQWNGAGGANMNAMFQNGRLIQKAQFGLR